MVMVPNAVGRAARAATREKRIVKVSRRAERRRGGEEGRRGGSEGDGKDDEHEHSRRYRDVQVPTIAIN